MTNKLPRCYFTVTVDGLPLGSIFFELCADICPKTCENFISLCTGEKGKGGVYGKPLCYRNSTFHRVVKNFMIQGGDFTHGSGVGGESIYGGVFNDENFILKHDQKYLLSMANRGPNTNGSQFFITTAPSPHLDNSHVVFGHVIDGEKFVDQIERTAVDGDHKPFSDIRITECGIVPGYGRGEQPDLPLPTVTATQTGDKEVIKAIGNKETVKTKRKKKDSSSDGSSSSDSDSSDSSDDSSDSDSDDQMKKLKKKKKKLTKIKKKLEKIAKKKKLKKSRAKKLKRVNEKLQKIDRLMNPDENVDGMMMSESDGEGKDKLKNSFLYRSSQSPPPRKKSRSKKASVNTERILDEEFFSKRGKVAGALLAPISGLHGGGPEEFSMTGPSDDILTVVNRAKVNVGPGVGGLEKAKLLGVQKVTVPAPNKAPVARNLTPDNNSSGKDSPQSSTSRKKRKKTEESVSDSGSRSRSRSRRHRKSRSGSRRRRTDHYRSRNRSSHKRRSRSRKRRSRSHKRRSQSRSRRPRSRHASSSSSRSRTRSSSAERYSGLSRHKSWHGSRGRGRGNFRSNPPRLFSERKRSPNRDRRRRSRSKERSRDGSRRSMDKSSNPRNGTPPITDSKKKSSIAMDDKECDKVKIIEENENKLDNVLHNYTSPKLTFG